MTILQSLSIKKKISAVFSDGSFTKNLGIPKVVELLHGLKTVPVELANDVQASELLAELALNSNRAIFQDGEGLSLVQVEEAADADEPVSAEATEVMADLAQAFVELAPAREDVVEVQCSDIEVQERSEVAPIPRMYRDHRKPQQRKRKSWEGSTRKYAQLSTTFWKGSLEGQIASVFKSRELNPQKVFDFKAAIENGDVQLAGVTLAPAAVKKLNALGINT